MLLFIRLSEMERSVFMRILHTSDWHLGVSLEQASREEEHKQFLDWLLDLLVENEVDVLLHGGDVFHTAQPAARSLRLYYRFLARCSLETKLQQIIIVGGNHASASRLDAPRDALEMLRVYVVGGMTEQDLGWEHYICPIYNDEGDPALVIAAMPYIHESHLGVRTTSRRPDEIRDDLNERFRLLYSSMSDMVERRYPDIPAVTTGHLTCYSKDYYKPKEEEAAYHTPLHLIEVLGGISPKIFHERFCYVALGHIHEKMEIPEANAWYPGSPIPTDVTEARTPCYVLQVDVQPDHTTIVTPIEVPRWRPIFELSGKPDDVLKEIEELEWEQELAPYLYVDFHVEAPLYEGLQRIDEILSKHPLERRPRVIRLKETLKVENESPDELDETLTPLDQLKPTDVFSQMFELKHEQPPSQEIMTAFSTLLSGDPDETA